ncbi:single-stranded DNA-binding protein [Jiangella anatolica]|nr:single-stranded DNA-binding protein [Jiangella anatolica]
MAIKVSQSINCFVASDPRLTFHDGKARLYARIGINHAEPKEGGGWNDLEPTFHDLVMFGKSAERSYEMLRKGDNVIAQGSVQTRPTVDDDGQEEEVEQFVAKRIGHDINLTTYAVQRKRSAGQEPASREAPAAGPATQQLRQPPPAPPPPPPHAEPMAR